VLRAGLGLKGFASALRAPLTPSPSRREQPLRADGRVCHRPSARSPRQSAALPHAMAIIAVLPPIPSRIVYVKRRETPNHLAQEQSGATSTWNEAAMNGS
jgi:hypothetical protein